MLARRSKQTFQTIAKVLDEVEVRAPCRPVRFFQIKLENPSFFFMDLALHAGELSCWNRKELSPKLEAHDCLSTLYHCKRYSQVHFMGSSDPRTYPETWLKGSNYTVTKYFFFFFFLLKIIYAGVFEVGFKIGLSQIFKLWRLRFWSSEISLKAIFSCFQQIPWKDQKPSMTWFHKHLIYFISLCLLLLLY